MPVTVPRSRSIRMRITRALLRLTLFSLISLTAVALWSMEGLGTYAIRSQVGLGEEAIRVSENALEDLAVYAVQRIVALQASRCSAQCRRVETQTNTLASSAAAAWRRSAPSPDEHDRPPSAHSVPPYYLAPGVSLSAVQRDLRAASALDDACRLTEANDPTISSIDLGTPTGLYREFPWTPPIPRGYDPRQRPWYKEAVEAGKPGWSAPYRDALTREPIISCYAPVYDDQRALVAVISVVMSLRTISERIVKGKLGIPGEQALLLDQQLRILGSDGGWKPAGQSPEYFAFDAKAPRQTRLAKQAMAREAARPTEGEPCVLEAHYNGTESVITYASVAATRWLYVLVLPTKEVAVSLVATKAKLQAQGATVGQQVRSHIARTLAVFSGVFLLMLAVVMVVSRRMANHIAAPVEALSVGARAIGSGDLDYRFEVHTGDELEALADTFNRTTADLREYMANLQETTAANERIESELHVATTIQTSVLPRTFPPFPHRSEFDISALMDPAREVGGDFYDFFFIDEKHFCFLIGDVADKGVPAALFMMVTKTMLKTEGLRAADPDEILLHANNLLAPDNETGTFVTVFCAILDTDTGEVCFSNAGHNPPLVRREGQGPELLALPKGLPLGAMPGSRYSTHELTLARGDVLVVYTDGVTDARNPSNELFGTKRLVQWLSEQSTSDVTELVHELREELDRFGGDTPQADDLTLLVVRFNGPSS